MSTASTRIRTESAPHRVAQRSRELAAREVDGLHVRLLWDPLADAVSVAVVDIRAGSIAMYYPEANVLVPRRLDARSKTPAFKSVAARVRRATARPV